MAERASGAVTGATGVALAGSPHHAVRVRCRALGLPTWRCDHRGEVVERPHEPGEAGVLLSSPGFAALVTGALRGWSESPGSDPEPAEVFPGAWALPLPERRRRRSTAYTVALALESTALEAPELGALARACGMDAERARGALAHAARHTPGSVRCVHELLRSMCDDLSALKDQGDAVAAFTTQLTDSYETIESLYAIGRAMGGVRHARGFVEHTTDRVYRTLAFAWVAARFVDDAELPADLRGACVLHGSAPAGVESALRFGPGGVPGRAFVDGLTPEGEGFHILGLESGLASPEHRQVLGQCLTRGGRVVGELLGGAKKGADPGVSSYDARMFSAAASYLDAFLDNAALYAEQEATFLGTVRALAAAIDAKDRYTRGHSERVALLSHALALASGMGPEQAEVVRVAGLVHDVGKIGVPERVLTKCGRLTDEEFDLIKQHPEIGHNILKDIPGLRAMLPGVLHHHERWDGKGYPHALAGESIPRIARIIGIADTFDAMSSTRSYRPAMDRARVLAEVARCAGTQFDPVLVPPFLTLDLTRYDLLVASAEPQTVFAAAA